MKNRSALCLVALFSCSVVFPWSTRAESPVAAQPATVETIIFVRHGEKPANDLGQLTFQGLNRALALPDVLIKKYGNADFIFAPSTKPDPAKNNGAYSYIRPLITIEPTAIRLGLPVNARIAFDDTAALQTELLAPTYQNALVFVAWEHRKLDEVVKNIMHALGGDPDTIPEWAQKDFDSIYVVKIRTENGKKTVTFQHDQEGLDGQSTQEPEPKKN
ncbi:MAG: histidine phosphatase family protein [Chthoniobacteraceae bacterium]